MLPMVSPFIPCRQWAVPRRPLSKTSCQGDPVRWNVLITESHGLRKHQDMVAERHLSSLFTVFYNLASPQLSSTLVLSVSVGERLFPPILQVGELRCKKPDSEVFPMQRKAPYNSQENSDKALQPSNISSVLATLMTPFLLSVSSSSQGRCLHFTSAPDAVLSANPSAGVVRMGGQRSFHLASWWITVMNGNHLERWFLLSLKRSSQVHGISEGHGQGKAEPTAGSYAQKCFVFPPPGPLLCFISLCTHNPLISSCLRYFGCTHFWDISNL